MSDSARKWRRSIPTTEGPSQSRAALHLTRTTQDGLRGVGFLQLRRGLFHFVERPGGARRSHLSAWECAGTDRQPIHPRHRLVLQQ